MDSRLEKGEVKNKMKNLTAMRQQIREDEYYI